MSFHNFTKSGRDSARVQTLNDIHKTLQLSDSTQSDQSLNYICSEADFQQALHRANISLSNRVYRNHCYFIGMVAGSTSSPKDNDFVITTWGENYQYFR